MEGACADPHAGWCGGRELITPGYPIMFQLFPQTLAVLASYILTLHMNIFLITAVQNRTGLNCWSGKTRHSES